jgi:protein-tyrosine phosphatase
MAAVTVCFVCLGNICRSPTAEAVFRNLLQARGLLGTVHVESAGTAAYHAGESPDSRSIAAAQRRGIPMRGAARQFRAADFERFDYVIAMDGSNFETLERQAPSKELLAKLHLARAFDPASPRGASVPDPYYSDDGFDEVIDLCEAACRGLLDHIIDRHGLGGG